MRNIVMFVITAVFLSSCSYQEVHFVDGNTENYFRNKVEDIYGLSLNYPYLNTETDAAFEHTGDDKYVQQVVDMMTIGVSAGSYGDYAVSGINVKILKADSGEEIKCDAVFDGAKKYESIESFIGGKTDLKKVSIYIAYNGDKFDNINNITMEATIEFSNGKKKEKCEFRKELHRETKTVWFRLP